MYAHVYVDYPVSSDGIFTYQIPLELAAHLRIGSLVIVPFRHKNIRGVVVKFTRTHKLNVPPRSIKKIVFSGPVLSIKQWQLIKWLVNFYGCHVNQAIFTVLPNFKFDYSDHAPPIPVENQRLKRSARINFFIVPDWSQRIEFIKKSMTNVSVDGQVLWLAAPGLDIHNILKELPEAHFYSANLQSELRSKLWLDVGRGNIKLIIGSRSALFLPYKHLSLVICDRPYHPSQFEERAPRYSSWQVVQFLAMQHRADLLFTDEAVAPIITNPSNYHWPNKIHSPAITITSILKLTDLMDRLVVLVGHAIRQSQTLLILVPYRNDHILIRCLDCQSQLTVTLDRCPKCHSSRLKNWSINIKLIQRLIQQRLSFNKVQIIDRNNNFAPVQPIVVATQQVFDYHSRFRQAVAIGFDPRLQSAEPHSFEYVYRVLAQLSNRAIDQVTILTSLAHHRLYGLLKNPRAALPVLIDLRRAAKIYPFGHIIRVTTEEPASQTALTQIKKITGVNRVTDCYQSEFKPFRWSFLVYSDHPQTSQLVNQYFRSRRPIRIDVDPLTLL